MSLQPGKQVTDSLRLVRLLGRGAMGSVWLADHLRLQSRVAVKFMAPAMAEDETSVRRFTQEAKAAAEIRSPHVVRVFDHGQTEDGQLYIVMEALEGDSLERQVRRDGVLSGPVASAVVHQCCKALSKAHERGIVHRDIKPPNVFLLAGDDVFVKLLDFGVAKFSGEEALEMTAAGFMVGTPAFMSPEQLFKGSEVDHRADLWSLAVVTYFALSGERAFAGKTLGELCAVIKGRSFVPMTERRPDLPATLDAWFERAWHEDIEQRFQSAGEFAAAFGAIVGIPSGITSTPSLHEGPLQTFPGTTISSQSSLVMPRRTRWPVAVGAAIGVALLAGAGAVLFGSGGEAAPPVAPAAPPAPATPEPEPEPEAELDDEPELEPSASAEASASASTRAPPPPVVAPGPAPTAAPVQDDRAKRAADELGI